MWTIEELLTGWSVCRDGTQVALQPTREGAIECMIAAGALDDQGGFVAAAVPISDTGAGFHDPRFHGVLIVEGERTTDGRQIDPLALTWRTLPLPLMHQYEEPEFGAHSRAVLVGRIDDISRVGSEILFAGVWDASYQADEAHRLVEAQMMRWVSADVEVIDAEVMVEGPDCEIDPFLPDCTWFEVLHKGRVMGGTIVAFPAFPQAVIAAESDPIPQATIDGRAAAETLVASADCMPCVEKLRRHLVASTTIELPDAPSRSWFDEPHMEEPMAVVVDGGRIYGILAQRGVCHTGYPRDCQTAPLSASGYAYFLTGGPVVCDDGSLVRVGQLTMGCGHAEKYISPEQAMAHYDGGPGAIQVADVVVGESEDNQWIWYSGRIRPGLTAEQLVAFSSTQVSGDWRKLRGSLELIAATSVPVPGFPIMDSLAAGGSLVASAASAQSGPYARIENGEVVVLLAAGRIPRPDPLRALQARLDTFVATTESALAKMQNRLLTPEEAAERIRARVKLAMV